MYHYRYMKKGKTKAVDRKIDFSQHILRFSFQGREGNGPESSFIGIRPPSRRVNGLTHRRKKESSKLTLASFKTNLSLSPPLRRRRKTIFKGL